MIMWWGQSAASSQLRPASTIRCGVASPCWNHPGQPDWNRCASGEPLDRLQSATCRWCQPPLQDAASTLSTDHIAPLNMLRSWEGHRCQWLCQHKAVTLVSWPVKVLCAMQCSVQGLWLVSSTAMAAFASLSVFLSPLCWNVCPESSFLLLRDDLRIKKSPGTSWYPYLPKDFSYKEATRKQN